MGFVQLHELHPVGAPFTPQTVTNATVTSDVIPIAGRPRVKFAVAIGAMAAGNTLAIQIKESASADGSSSSNITGALSTATANGNVSVGTVDVSAAAAGDTVTITPSVAGTAGTAVTFTRAAATLNSTRTFLNAAGLAADINDATYGVTGITAVANAEVVTLTATSPGEAVFSIAKTEVAGTLTLATVRALVWCEIDTPRDMTEGYGYLIASITAAGAIICALTVFEDSVTIPAPQNAAATRYYGD